MVSKFKVLVAEDDRDKRQLLTIALEREGYEVCAVDDGLEALRAVETFQPDLIITDVIMPQLDGYELARRLRENPQTRFIPIIIQTAARWDANDMRRGAEVGALGYVTDPTDLSLLLAHARTLLEFKEYLDSCEEAAFTDHLTGLANRRRFERQLAREVARTRRYGHPFCLLMIDIDHFKEINDTFGHVTGDAVIRQVARILQSSTRGIDVAARIGGDEFAVILPETRFEAGLDVAERLRQAIKSTKMSSEVETVTASFGIAEFPASAEDEVELFRRADAALYEAKRNGRDCVKAAPKRGEQNWADRSSVLC
ncbi:GGDEF domain-containing response regulator [Pyrinomonas methylaliphatogenes]|jgi:diguanylate cyclase (GGDEF)-like protein|uniref:diguanylate cyclase n=1 Tax=Pyrinomonas methylaliphatogenes TaxID=454194 RepID=A0A0B6WS73_9BACT|nr:diguanylate cyclase [Pyrinomonas methylaliphatogenes]MBX5478914.1 diguanylate cyclase [Pyrinomonas methylaliphatogenes]CDM64048.1 diguanylate cyclase (GGDEF) domain-containing protein [Pyrinomonas methylaliphatogenes]